MRFIIPFITVAAVASAADKMRIEYTGYRGTCTNIELSSGYPGKSLQDNLKAICYNDNGKDFENNLDLNQCVGVDHTSAKLSWSIMGKLRNYCDSCTLQHDNLLECKCSDAGIEATSTLDLEGGISNQNGTLVCTSNLKAASVENIHPDPFVPPEPESCWRIAPIFAGCKKKGKNKGKDTRK